MLDTLLQRVDKLKSIIDSRRPLTAEETRQLNNYFKIGATYSSNALEGNSLTLSETKVLLEDGITVGGKPVRDIYEATGHADAFDFMLTSAKAEPLEITEDLIRGLHRLFYQRQDAVNAGQYRDIRVIITGTEYVPPAPERVPGLMREFITALSENSAKLHPVIFAAYAHRRLVDIHPFADGNGRAARLLMNLILVNKGYFVVSIPPVRRQEYIDALRISQRKVSPSDIPFNKLIAECVYETQKDYCRMFEIPIKSDRGAR